MEIGIPKETRDLEMRVGVTPAGVLAMVQAGHTVYVERGAGAGAGFSDEHYRRAGAQIVYSAAEAFGRADLVAKVSRPTAQEHRFFRHGQTICSFLHLSVSSPDLLDALIEREITAVAYDTMQDEDGLLPVVEPMSEIAGRLTPIIAGRLLMNNKGGRGILLSGIPGVPPAAIVILQAGFKGLKVESRIFSHLPETRRRHEIRLSLSIKQQPVVFKEAILFGGAQGSSRRRSGLWT